MFAQRTSSNIQSNNVIEIKQWIYNVKEMSKKVERLPQGDTRRYFSWVFKLSIMCICIQV